MSSCCVCAVVRYDECIMLSVACGSLANYCICAFKQSCIHVYAYVNVVCLHLCICFDSYWMCVGRSPPQPCVMSRRRWLGGYRSISRSNGAAMPWSMEYSTGPVSEEGQMERGGGKACFHLFMLLYVYVYMHAYLCIHIVWSVCVCMYGVSAIYVICSISYMFSFDG